MSYGTTELPYTAARIKGIIKATGQITVKPAGLAGIQLDCNGATGDFTASITPANLTGNRRWILPNRDDTFAGLGAQTFTGAQTFAQDVTVDKTGAGLTLAIRADDTRDANISFLNRSGVGIIQYRPVSSTDLRWYTATAGIDILTLSNAAASTGALSVGYSTASTSTTTGALVVAGGVGIGGRLNVGGEFRTSNFRFSATQFDEIVTNATASIALNYGGYLGGTTQFRNTDFYDGKNVLVATMVGSTKTLAISGPLEVSSATLIKSNTTLTDGAAAAVGTLTNAPTAGNPTKWVLINDNGVIRKFPTWT